MEDGGCALWGGGNGDVGCGAVGWMVMAGWDGGRPVVARNRWLYRQMSLRTSLVPVFVSFKTLVS